MPDLTDIYSNEESAMGGQVAPIFRFAVTDEVLEKNTGVNFLPTKAHATDTGWDVRAANSIKLRAGQYAKIPLGFRVLAPGGWWLECRPRSSSFIKKQLHALYGVIDTDFCGQCMFCCQYLPDISAMGQDLIINFGDAIGQFIPVRRQEMIVQNISNEEYDRQNKLRQNTRGEGGFGSSDQGK